MLIYAARSYNVALAAGIRTHRAIGEQQRHRAIRREVVEHVLDPGEVGIPDRRVFYRRGAKVAKGRGVRI